jgi:peptide/nickel transport system substrate-binding protein
MKPAQRGQRRAGLRLGLTGLAALSAVACLVAVNVTAATAQPRATDKPVLTIGRVGSPTGLDPAANAVGGIFTLLGPIAYAPLMHFKADGTIGPGLATSWRYLTSKAGSLRANKDFMFTLRRNARFSDGAPVTAQAVKDWLLYFNNANSPMAAAMAPIQSIETQGKWTVVIHLKSPCPILPYTLSEAFNWGFVAGPSGLRDPKSLGTTTNGAGPYMLDPSETVTNNVYTFVPNPYFYDKSAVKFSKIVVKIIGTPDSMLQALTTGQLDVAQGDATTAGAASGFTVLHAPAGAAGFIFQDKSGALSKPLADVRVRQALNYAVDRKAITAAVLGNLGAPTSEWYTLDGFDPKLQNSYPYDPAKAKALLRAAGYADGFTIPALGSPPAAGTRVTLEQAIAKYLKDVGVTVNFAPTTTPAQFNSERAKSGRYAVFTAQRGGDMMWQFWNLAFKPNSAFNEGSWHDRQLDKLWLVGQRSPTPKKYWMQMSERMVSQALFLPVYMNPQIWYVSKKIGGVLVTPGHPIGTNDVTEWFPK